MTPLLFLLGLVWGSFLNVVIHRLPQMKAAGIVANGRGALFLAWPLSFCPACKAPIAPEHNIPVVSYLMLRGKCAACRAPISPCYPLVELCGGAIFAAAAWRFAPAQAAAAMFLLSILLVLAVIDMRRLYLPHILTMPLLAAGLINSGLLDGARFISFPDAFSGAAGGFSVLWLLATAVGAVKGRAALGGGDLWLAAALGAWLGWRSLALALFLASVGGLIYALWRAWRGGGRRRRLFPFGPFIAAGGAAALFIGDRPLAEYFGFAPAGQF